MYENKMKCVFVQLCLCKSRWGNREVYNHSRGDCVGTICLLFPYHLSYYI